jgi:hypothetical protein
MSFPTTDPLSDFSTLRRELEQQALLLNTSTDPEDRRRLLRELRLMLARADRLLSSEQ